MQIRSSYTGSISNICVYVSIFLNLGLPEPGCAHHKFRHDYGRGLLSGPADSESDQRPGNPAKFLAHQGFEEDHPELPQASATPKWQRSSSPASRYQAGITRAARFFTDRGGKIEGPAREDHQRSKGARRSRRRTRRLVKPPVSLHCFVQPACLLKPQASAAMSAARVRVARGDRNFPPRRTGLAAVPGAVATRCL